MTGFLIAKFNKGRLRCTTSIYVLFRKNLPHSLLCKTNVGLLVVIDINLI